MKKIIYSIITDETFGIKVKDDMKLNILRILDKTKGKVNCQFYHPIQISDNKIEEFSLEFFCPDDSTFIANYRLENEIKSFRVSLLPTVENPNLVEDYMIIEHSNGLIEYKTRYVYKNNNNHSKNEYYYNGEEISEEEASNLLNPKTK